MKQLINKDLDPFLDYDQTDFSLVPDSKTDQDHCHNPDPATIIKAKIYKKCKRSALVDLHRGTSSILNEVFRHFAGQPGSYLVQKDYARRVINRVRQQLRPRPPSPTDIWFLLHTTYESLANFFRHDLRVDIPSGSARHLIFIMEWAKELLKTWKRWWIGATFKIIKLPFTQLFTISAFVKSERIDNQGTQS